MNMLSYILIMLFILQPAFHSGLHDGFVVVHEENDIIIFEGTLHSDKNHFKSHFYIKSSREEALKMLLTPANYAVWIDNILESKMVIKKSDSLMYSQAIIGVKGIFSKEGILKTTVKNKHDQKISYIKQSVDSSIEYAFEHKKFNPFMVEWKLETIIPNELVLIEMTFIGEKDNYPGFIDRILRSIFIRNLYNISYEIRSALNN